MGAIRTAALLVCLVVLFADGQDYQPTPGQKKVVCYFTSWSHGRAEPYTFTPEKIDPFLCTHVIYAFADIGSRNNLVMADSDYDKIAFASMTSLKKKNKDLKVMISVGGWREGTVKFAGVTANDTNRKEFAENTVRFLRGYKFDGIDLNWQHPTFREGGSRDDKENYVLLAQTLREVFELEAFTKDKPRLLLSIAITHTERFLPGYDIASFNNYMDFISVICYDYHFSHEDAVNHHSPLYSLEDDNEYSYDPKANINYTISLFSEFADPDKLILGIPTYGRTYKLVNPDDREVGSFADGAGDAGPVTQEKGFFAYFEICDKINNDDWSVVQTKPGRAGPYAYKDDQWVGYDDLDMIRNKAAYVIEMGLGGVMFWTIDYDDFLKKCHDTTFPLVRTARNELIPSLATFDGSETTKDVTTEEMSLTSEIPSPDTEQPPPRITRTPTSPTPSETWDPTTPAPTETRAPTTPAPTETRAPTTLAPTKTRAPTTPANSESANYIYTESPSPKLTKKPKVPCIKRKPTAQDVHKPNKKDFSMYDTDVSVSHVHKPTRKDFSNYDFDGE